MTFPAILLTLGTAVVSHATTTTYFEFFFSTKFVSSKQSLLIPIATCITILIYTFLIFNHSINAYKQEFEVLASLIMGLFLLKVFLNE